MNNRQQPSPNDIATLKVRIASGEQPDYADFPEDYVLQANDSGDRMWIDWFHIPDALRGKGHGRAFYQAIEQWVRDGEVVTTEIRLMAADSGEGPSDGFWEKMGFHHISPNAQNYEQAHMMRKYLTADQRHNVATTDDATETYCATNDCEEARCHRCFPRTDCQDHEKCRAWAKEEKNPK